MRIVLLCMHCLLMRDSSSVCAVRRRGIPSHALSDAPCDWSRSEAELNLMDGAVKRVDRLL